MTHFNKMKGKMGSMAVKIDLEKAFDRLEWPYIKNTLVYFWFLDKLSELIMSCITTSTIQVLINGRKMETFHPTRGIRQGDPMSPYIFILYMERLSRTILNSVEHRLWDLIKICTTGPNLSHLLFANDLTLFVKANMKNCNIIVSTLLQFRELSGQKVNFGKSRVIFSKNYQRQIRDQYMEALNIEEKEHFGKYLGFSILHGIPNSNDFQYIINNMRRRLTGWKCNMLNMAGQLILPKVTLGSISSHVMSYIRIPEGVTKTIDKITRDFLWGFSAKKKKMHLFKWDMVTKSKDLGGLGLHKFVVINKAIINGLAW